MPRLSAPLRLLVAAVLAVPAIAVAVPASAAEATGSLDLPLAILEPADASFSIDRKVDDRWEDLFSEQRPTAVQGSEGRVIVQGSRWATTAWS